MENSFDLSIVIPAYNEETRIFPTLETVISYAARNHSRAEIIVVDDGSTDSTRKIVLELSAKTPFLKLLTNPVNEGKGSSVRKGVAAARGELIYFTDADLATPVDEIGHFLKEIEDCDVVIGSRAVQLGANIVVHEPLFRELLGKLFNRFVRLLCMPEFLDTQCGAKMFRREVAKKIFPLVKISKFAFDVEVLYLANVFHYKVKEMPVKWLHSPNTRVRTFLDGPRMLVDLMRIKWLHRDLVKEKGEGEGAS